MRPTMHVATCPHDPSPKLNWIKPINKADWFALWRLTAPDSPWQNPVLFAHRSSMVNLCVKFQWTEVGGASLESLPLKRLKHGEAIVIIVHLCPSHQLTTSHHKSRCARYAPHATPSAHLCEQTLHHRVKQMKVGYDRIRFVHDDGSTI